MPRMNRFAMSICLILMLIASSFVHADERADAPFQVRVQVDRWNVTIVDTIELTIGTRASLDWMIENPFESLMSGDELGDLTVTRVEIGEPALHDDGSIARSMRITLEPYLPGETTIPSMEFAGRRIDGVGSHVLRSSPIRIHVRSLLAQDASDSFQPGRIREPIEPPRETSLTPVWITIGMILVVAFIVSLVLILRLRFRGHRRALQTRLHERRDELQRSANLPAPESTHAQRRILREALTELIGPQAKSATTNELHSALRAVQLLDESSRTELQMFFDRADRALFEPTNGVPGDSREERSRAEELLDRIERATLLRFNEEEGRAP